MKLKTGMFKPICIIASVLAVAASVPPAAASTSGEDPGAFATLGSVYLSSILEQAGIGSGGSGKSVGAGSGALGRNMTAGSGAPRVPGGNGAAAVSPGGAGSGKDASAPDGPPVGDVASGGDPQTPPYSPGASGPSGGNSGGDPYEEVFKDPPGGGIPGGSGPDAGDGSTNPPANGFPGTPWPAGTTPDDVLSDEGGLTLPPVAAIAPAASVVQVPEPASLALFGAGLLLVGLFARRRV